MEKNLDLKGIRPSIAEPERKDAPVMSRESVDSFLSFLESSGRTKQTADMYRRCLSHLFSFLPDDKKNGRMITLLVPFHKEARFLFLEILLEIVFYASRKAVAPFASVTSSTDRKRKFPTLIFSHQF